MKFWTMKQFRSVQERAVEQAVKTSAQLDRVVSERDARQLGGAVEAYRKALLGLDIHWGYLRPFQQEDWRSETFMFRDAKEFQTDKLLSSLAFTAKKPEIDFDIVEMLWTGRADRHSDPVEEMEFALGNFVDRQYLETEASFGKFKLVDLTGLQLEDPNRFDAKTLFRALREVERLFKQKGFGFLLGGILYLDHQPGKRYGAAYHRRTDRLEVNTDAGDVRSLVRSLVHELAHRIWFRHLTSGQRDRFSSRWIEQGDDEEKPTTRLPSVTPYGTKNRHEDFAETFTEVVMGRQKDRRLAERLQAVLPKGRVLSSAPTTSSKYRVRTVQDLIDEGYDPRHAELIHRNISEKADTDSWTKRQIAREASKHPRLSDRIGKKTVTVYRVVPRNIKSINLGDYVFLKKQDAEDFREEYGVLRGQPAMISMKADSSEFILPHKDDEELIFVGPVTQANVAVASTSPFQRFADQLQQLLPPIKTASDRATDMIERWAMTDELNVRQYRRTLTALGKKLEALKSLKVPSDLRPGEKDILENWLTTNNELVDLSLGSLKRLHKGGTDNSPQEAIDIIRINVYDIVPTTNERLIWLTKHHHFVERGFRFEGFDVTDDFGILVKDLQPWFEAVTRAARILKRHGLGYLLYGKLSFARGHGWSGLYIPKGDSIDLDVSHRRPDIDWMVNVLVHELGHRCWFKFLDGGARDRFATRWIERDEAARKLWQEFQDVFRMPPNEPQEAFELAWRTEYSLPAFQIWMNKKPERKLRWLKYLGGVWPDPSTTFVKDGKLNPEAFKAANQRIVKWNDRSVDIETRQLNRESLEQYRKRQERTWTDESFYESRLGNITYKSIQEMLEPAGGLYNVSKGDLGDTLRNLMQIRPVDFSVTQYGNTNRREDFAETFTQVLNGREKSRDVKQRLQAVLPKGRVLSSTETVAAPEIADRTTVNLKREYDAFNRKLWDGRLPAVPVKWSRSKQLGGRVVTRGVPTDPSTWVVRSLEISDFMEVPYDRFLGLLVHEMIHVHIMSSRLQDRGQHGPRFMDERSRVAKLVPFDIPLTEDITRQQVSRQVKAKPLGVVLFGKRGAIQVYRADAIEQVMRDMSGLPAEWLEMQALEFFVVEDRELAKYPIKRKFAKGRVTFYPVEQPVIDRIRAGKSLGRLPVTAGVVQAADRPEWVEKIESGKGTVFIGIDDGEPVEWASWLKRYMMFSKSKQTLDIEGYSLLSPELRGVLQKLVKQYPPARKWSVRSDGPAQPIDRLLRSRSPRHGMPKHLYHGTSTELLPRIMKEGLKPRTTTSIKPTYQGGAKEGRPERVYLAAFTSLQATHFAAREAARKHGGDPVVLRVKTRGLRFASFKADEDSKVDDYDWVRSLYSIGTVAYEGSVPPKALSVYSKLKERDWVRASVGQDWFGPGGQRFRIVQDTGPGWRVEIQHRRNTLPAEESWTFTKRQFERMKSTLPLSTESTAAPIEAYWLDSHTGKTIEIPRGGGRFTYHMHEVVDNPGTYGLERYADQLAEMKSRGEPPSEIRDYPAPLVRELLSRWVKVYKQMRTLNLTSADRLDRRLLESMQDFVMERRLTDRKVVLMAEPSSRIVAEMPGTEFVTAELRDFRSGAAGVVAASGFDQVLSPATVKKLRADFLMLMKNIKRLKDYRQTLEWHEAVNRWANRLETYMNSAANEIGQFRRDEISPDLIEVWQQELRASLSNLIFAIRNTGFDRYELADRYTYRTHDRQDVERRLYDDFMKQAKTFDGRVKRIARESWKRFDSILQTMQRSWDERGLPGITVPQDRRLNIDGFSVTLTNLSERGYYKPKDAIDNLKRALAVYRKRAGKVYPWLLRYRLPIVLDGELSVQRAAHYDVAEKTIWLKASSERPERVAHTIAHEMGHHVWREVLSAKDQEYWEAAIRGSRGPLDLREVRKHGSFSGLSEKLMQSDPVLALRIQTFEHDQRFKQNDMVTVEGIDRYLNAGNDPIVQVTTEPISGYAAKNPEEAFCEALGLLVAYGPRTVLPVVRQRLRTILPNLKTTASVVAAGPSEQQFKVLRKLGIDYDYDADRGLLDIGWGTPTDPDEPTHRRRNAKLPRGHVIQFAENPDRNRHYGPHRWTLQDRLPYVIEDDRIVEIAMDEFDIGRDEALEEINPRDIVDTAGAWDSQNFVSRVWEETEAPGFETQDGAVVLDPTGVKLLYDYNDESSDYVLEAEIQLTVDGDVTSWNGDLRDQQKVTHARIKGRVSTEQVGAALFKQLKAALRKAQAALKPKIVRGRVTADPTEIASGSSEIPFKVGDVVRVGKYKNRLARVIRFSENDKGQMTVLVDPVPKGRKKTKEMGLFKIWTTPDAIEAIASTDELYHPTGLNALARILRTRTFQGGDRFVRFGEAVPKDAPALLVLDTTEVRNRLGPVDDPDEWKKRHPDAPLIEDEWIARNRGDLRLPLEAFKRIEVPVGRRPVVDALLKRLGLRIEVKELGESVRAAAARELHVFDFDGTLFRSPTPADWWDGPRGDWYRTPQSLDPPCVPKKPDASWWVGQIVQQARNSIADPNVMAIVLTGRQRDRFGKRVPELLRAAGLKFEQVLLKLPGMRTADFKEATISRLHRKHQFSHVRIWDDRHTGRYRPFVEKLGLPCTVHPGQTHERPPGCTEEDMKHAG